MKKKIILVLLFVTLVSSLSAKNPRKFIDRIHTDVGFAYSPSFIFSKDKDSGTNKTSLNNSFIINNDLTFEGSKIGVNIGTYGTFPFMIQASKDNSVLNTPINGTQQNAIIAISVCPSLNLYKNELAVIKAAIGPKFSTQFITTQTTVDLVHNVGVELDLMARVLGNNYINFLIGIKQDVNFYLFGEHKTIDKTEKYDSSDMSYELYPYIGINLHL